MTVSYNYRFSKMRITYDLISNIYTIFDCSMKQKLVYPLIYKKINFLHCFLFYATLNLEDVELICGTFGNDSVCGIMTFLVYLNPKIASNNSLLLLSECLQISNFKWFSVCWVKARHFCIWTKCLVWKNLSEFVYNSLTMHVNVNYFFPYSNFNHVFLSLLACHQFSLIHWSYIYLSSNEVSFRSFLFVAQLVYFNSWDFCHLKTIAICG